MFKIVSRLVLSIQAYNMVNFFKSILFRIVSRLNHFQLPLLVLSKLNNTCFR